jgi:hypothetical protein
VCAAAAQTSRAENSRSTFAFGSFVPKVAILLTHLVEGRV